MVSKKSEASMALHVEKWRYDKYKNKKTLLLNDTPLIGHTTTTLFYYSTTIKRHHFYGVSTTDGGKKTLSPLNVYFITTFQLQQSGFYNNNINAPSPTNGIFFELGSL